MRIFLLLISFLSPIFAKSQYSKLLDFANDTVHGYSPYSSLYSDQNFLYGVTYKGGLYDKGTIFKVKYDGSSYSKLFDFSGVASGENPISELISDGNFLYGITLSGGITYSGTIYKIKPDGTGYVKLHDFTGGVDGGTPYGSLFFDGTFLYGVTQAGGTDVNGVIYKIMPDGTGFSIVFDFNSVTDAAHPTGTLYSDGIFLYGMTGQSANSMGTIYKIKSDGSSFIKLLDFSGTANGSNPKGSLISDGIYLYGMTFQGGADNYGTIFKIKVDGSGYDNLFDFNTANGTNPTGSLLFDSNFLYGMTVLGGANSLGNIFKIKTDGSNFSKLLDFGGSANGSSPRGSLITDGTFLYGMTTSGGTNNKGTVFKYSISTGIDEMKVVSSINVFPNPTNGSFSIQSPKTISQIEIFNIIGEKIYSSQINSNQSEINLSNYPSGIYFLQMKSDENIYYQKLLRQ